MEDMGANSGPCRSGNGPPDDHRSLISLMMLTPGRDEDFAGFVWCVSWGPCASFTGPVAEALLNLGASNISKAGRLNV